MSSVGFYILGHLFLNEIHYTLAMNTQLEPSFSNNIRQRNTTLSILVVSIGASQRSQSMQRITQELSHRGHRIRMIYPGRTDSIMNSSWNYNLEWIPVRDDLKTEYKFSESPVDYTLRLLWQERHCLFDVISKEIQKDRPDMIVADMGVFAAWDIADFSGLKDILLPPPLSGGSRNATLLQTALFVLQKWLYELHASPALHKLNRLRWYQGLDSYRSIRDLLCRKHIYLFPTTFAFEIPRSLSSYYWLSGPIVSQCTESLPNSAIEFAKLYSEQVVLINLEGAYLSRVVTLSIVNELHTLLTGFWWMNGSYVQPEHLPNNFYSLQRQLFGCALSSSMVGIVVVPCLSDVVQEVLYFGKPVLCVATGAVQLDVATRLTETHAGESIFTSGISILDELTTKLQDMFGNLESYHTAALEISLKIRMETYGLNYLCDSMESILYLEPVTYENTNSCVDSFISTLFGRCLFYFAIAYVVWYFLFWFAKVAYR
ncbi:hypothetical protein Gasu2_69650 [Galdieria sulphuraria]|nr:hypothetical protein Gasu2_69650 [Galdieria sulphuraria]